MISVFVAFVLTLALWAALVPPRPAPALPLEKLDIGAAAVLDAAQVLTSEEREALEKEKESKGGDDAAADTE